MAVYKKIPGMKKGPTTLQGHTLSDFKAHTASKTEKAKKVKSLTKKQKEDSKNSLFGKPGTAGAALRKSSAERAGRKKDSTPKKKPVVKGPRAKKITKKK